MTDFNIDFSQLRRNNIEEYGRFQQHLVLIEDRLRIETYYNAIFAKSPGNVILDIGAGTGILSLIGLKNGFDHAILIEPSKKICAYAEYLLIKNGFGDKFTIVNSTLEAVNLSTLPDNIDLVVSETISSVIFGFGSWDYVGLLKSKLSKSGSIIPSHGTLFGFLSEDDLATRNPLNSGLRYCQEMGLDIDLYFRTFRSGGNIFAKESVNVSIDDQDIFAILNFDFKANHILKQFETKLLARECKSYLGVVFYWEIFLDDDREFSLSSRDPNLTSWYPVFFPFNNYLKVTKGEEMNLKIKCEPIDAPYKYAFRIYNWRQPVTNLLYW